jgi:hypothetical protein
MSPITKYSVFQLIYKYWIRELIINKIKNDEQYQHLLQLCDTLMDYRKETESWEYGKP